METREITGNKDKNIYLKRDSDTYLERRGITAFLQKKEGGMALRQ